MDEEGLLAEEIDLKEETGLSPSRMMMDSNGLFHTINYNGNEYEYLVFDHDGYVLYRNAGNYINLYAIMRKKKAFIISLYTSGRAMIRQKLSTRMLDLGHT